MPHHRPSRPFVVAAVVLAVAGTTGCSGSSTPTPAPTPSAVPLRSVEVCPASVVVPPDTVSTAPDAAAPPTVTVRVGAAISFAVPSGARVGVLGSPDPDNDAQLCSPTKPTAGTAVFAALGEGFLRLGVQVGIQPVATVYVKVTPG